MVDISETQALLSATGLANPARHGSGKITGPRDNVSDEHSVEKRPILCQGAIVFLFPKLGLAISCILMQTFPKANISHDRSDLGNNSISSTIEFFVYL